MNLHDDLMREIPIASSQCGLTISPSRIKFLCKFTILDRKIVIFEFVSDADDLVTPNNSHECPIGP